MPSKESGDHNYQQILGYKDAFNQKQSRNGLNKKELWLPTLLENATANMRPKVVNKIGMFEAKV